MDRRKFLKTAAAPAVGAALTVEVAKATIERSANVRISKFNVVFLDGDKPVSDPKPCRFEMGTNYGTSLDSITLRGNGKESFRVTHIGLGEFKVPLDSGPEEIGPHDTFIVPSVNFSFGEDLSEA